LSLPIHKTLSIWILSLFQGEKSTPPKRKYLIDLPKQKATAAAEQDSQPKRDSALLIAQKSRKKTFSAVALGFLRLPIHKLLSI
jgi:hypothetical protein